MTGDGRSKQRFQHSVVLTSNHTVITTNEEINEKEIVGDHCKVWGGGPLIPKDKKIKINYKKYNIIKRRLKNEMK